MRAQAWREANRERHRAYSREWYAKNTERARTAIRDWQEKNPERKREHGRRAANAWSAAHPEKVAEGCARRRALKKGAPVIEKIDRAAIIERDRNICHLCRLPVEPHDIHLDHVVPLARGGNHTADNLAVAHSLCNARKGARMPDLREAS